MIPYPRHNESSRAWTSRCEEYERDQARWRKEQAARFTNWGGYNYRPVLNDCPNYRLEDGRIVHAIKVCRGASQANRARNFAIKNGLCFVKETIGRGMTKRTDGVAFVAPQFECYNSDDH
jgi:hypothetical protein